jgi:hypothetical protein
VGKGVVRLQRSKNGIVQRRHIKHLKKFNETHRRLGKAYERVVLEEKTGADAIAEKEMLQAFMKWGGDRRTIQRKIVEQFDRAPLNVESDGIYQKKLGEKYGNTKLRYDAGQKTLYITLRGYEYEQKGD